MYVQFYYKYSMYLFIDITLIKVHVNNFVHNFYSRNTAIARLGKSFSNSLHDLNENLSPKIIYLMNLNLLRPELFHGMHF